MPLSTPSKASQTPQWRELVVTPSTPSNIITPSSSLPSRKPETPDFQLSVAKASTPSSLVLPEMSPRYQALKKHADCVIEISPESHAYVAEFARRIGGSNPSSASSASAPLPKPEPSGAALILDYGPSNTIPTSTLRGIREHKLVSPFAYPGQVDISADVDFTALAEAAINASPGVEIHGPVEQGEWLKVMGIQERANMLIKKVQNGDEEAAKRIKSAVERLVERGGGAMGKLYKVMAIVPEAGGKRRPVGFGGDVVG